MFTTKLARVDIPEAGSLPDGLRIYCMSDLHGCADLLDATLRCIDFHIDRNPTREALEIHLGDMIDRGPQSNRVLSLLSGPAAGRKRILLRGNHEQRLLDLLDDPSQCTRWLYEGGYETLLSYGVPAECMRLPLDSEKTISILRQNMGAHIDLLRETRLSYEIGNLLFVHAGVDPAMPIENQRARDLLSIREPFLSYKGKLARLVVHGHTPSGDVERRAHRIGIDTGAYATGKVSCLVIERESAFIMTIAGKSAAGEDTGAAPSH